MGSPTRSLKEASLMQCLTAGQCALRAMVDLALHSDQGQVSCSDIAERQRLSEPYLSDLLLKLEQAGLVHQVGGPDGGYTIACDAAQISVRDIRLAVETRRYPVPCRTAECEPGCQSDADRPGDWLAAQEHQSACEVWDVVTLADLCERAAESDTRACAGQELETRFESNASRATHERYFSAYDSLEAICAFQQSIVDGVAEPIMVIDTEYRIRLMNRAARRFFSQGMNPTEPLLCYRVSHRRASPCDEDTHPCPLRQVTESGLPATVVHEHYQASGERRIVELSASPFWGTDGECHGIIESARDITERTRAKESLQRYAARLRALTKRLAEVAESEREALARELHDQVGQNLTALGINLNIVRTQMPPDTGPVVHSRLDDSLALVQQTTERIRNVMAELRPPVLDDYGLISALHWHAEQFTQRTEIAVMVESDEPIPRLDRRAETALFRIAQEALTNVAKHAQASHVAVTVEADGNTVRLVIADDGVGFDFMHLAKRNSGRGWGLLTMAERAEAVGGQCFVESFPGLGTRVVVEISQ
jgi:Rrf2 family protein